MRAVGMLRTGFILVILIISYANTLPLQYLPSIPGYVPVYIRNGDEPLEDVNLALAEAFAEHSTSKILKDPNVILEVEQPVDYELLSNNARDDAIRKGTNEVSEISEITEKQSEDLVEVLRLQDEGAAVPPMQRRETTNRSNLQKKSEAVTLEVNRSRIPQLLTAEEHEDERISDSQVKTDKPNQITDTNDSTIQVSNVAAKENDDSEKSADDVEKSDLKPNELIDPNPNYPELPAEIPQQHNSQDFGSANENHQDIVNPIASLQQEEPSKESELSSNSSSSSSSESEESSENEEISNSKSDESE